MNKYLKILEFDKIIQLIANYTRLNITKEHLNELTLSNNRGEIEKMLLQVDEASQLIQRMGLFPLYFTAPLHLTLLRLHKGGVITPSEAVDVGNFLDTIKANYLYWEKCDNANISAPHYIELIEGLVYVKELNLHIKQVVNNYGEIQDEASSTLKNIRKQIRDLEKRIEQKLQEILVKEKDKLSQATISIRNERYVIPVKNDYKNMVKGIIHDQSASRETVFIEPFAVNNMTNELKLLQSEEAEEIARILHALTGEIDAYYEEFTYSLAIIADLDLIFSKAEYAITLNAQRPKISDDGALHLIACYHPLLNVEKIIKNNVSIGQTYQGIIITGPNTGGKTVLLKTIGLLCLMVKAGMLIPAQGQSSVPLYSGVYADIGDEQSISQNLSTFSSHLTNVSQIIKLADEKSLILLDELGSGTDPIEGAALAISIFDYLINKRSHIIATSHYSELKLHAYRTNKVSNASVEFDELTLQPTYKLLIGVPGMSNALKIASALGLPEEIIKEATSYTFKKSDDINLILEKLVCDSHELEKRLLHVAQVITEYQTKVNEVEQEKKQLLASQKDILEKANLKAQKLIEKSLTESLELISELKSRKQEVVKLHELAEYTRRLRALDEETVKIYEQNEDSVLNLNDNVFLKQHQLYGVIIKTLPNERYEVRVGNAIMKVHRHQLVKDEPLGEQVNTLSKKNITVSVKRNIASTLDLRGKRYSEATELLDKFIDEAVYANLETISIIHGFGTGTIRKLVLDTLKSSPLIAEFRFGGAGEGGQGVTIASLKK